MTKMLGHTGRGEGLDAAARDLAGDCLYSYQRILEKEREPELTITLLPPAPPSAPPLATPQQPPPAATAAPPAASAGGASDPDLTSSRQISSEPAAGVAEGGAAAAAAASTQGEAGLDQGRTGQQGGSARVERVVHIQWRVHRPGAGLHFGAGYACTDGQVGRLFHAAHLSRGQCSLLPCQGRG